MNHRIRPALQALALALTIAACAPAGASPEEEADRLVTWLDDVFEAELEYAPEFKARLGIIDHSYGLWSDRSDEAEVAEIDRTTAYLDTLASDFDLESLSDEGRTFYLVAEHRWQTAIRLHERRDAGYVFSPINDEVSFLTSFLANNHAVRDVAHAEAYLERLSGLADVIDAMTARAERRAEGGTRLPLFAYDRLTVSARNQITGRPFTGGDAESPLRADFRAKVEALDMSTSERDRLLSEAGAILLDSYRPAIQRYLASLAAIKEMADERAGIWSNPYGAEFYRASIASMTTRSDLSAADIHEMGLEDVTRIQDEMRGILDQIDFEGSLQEFFVYARTDDSFYYSNDTAGREELMAQSREYIRQLLERAPEYFNRLPEAELEVRAVEQWREETAGLAFYNLPSFDGSRPGYYYMNLANMRDWPIFSVETLAYHEGAPGHHFQIAIAQELTGVPKMIKYGGFGAYIEGWGLYAERLGKEMGFFTNPLTDFGRLTNELLRAVRLVVDTGIHHHRWTREQAIDYMLANLPYGESYVVNEVERYIAWPAQALCYKIGMLSILDARERARDRLGPAFDIGAFHDVVLTRGAVPLDVLDLQIDEWVNQTLEGD